MPGFKSGASFVVALLAASPATAGLIELKFTGVVAATPTEGLAIRQPDGSLAPYRGADPPAYPVKAGDSVTVTFTGHVPDIGGPTPPAGSDGIYRYPLTGPNSVGNPSAFLVGEIDIGGIGRADGRGSQDFGAGGFDLVYNSRTGEYAIDLGTDGGYAFGAVNLPSYRYDPVADLFAPARNCGSDEAACPSSSAQGTLDTLTFSAINIYSPSGAPIGTLGPLVLRGSFSLPAYGAPAAIDAPPVLPLFAGALALLGWRLGRRRRQ